MPIVPRALVEEDKLAARIAEIEKKLRPDVIRIRHSIGDDWAGEPAIHFRVILSDEAARPERLRAVTNKVRSLISTELDPPKNWGLLAYVRFRSQSEQANLQELSWA